MRTSLSLIRRELTSYFLSPVGYVALVLFLAGMGVLFRFTMGLLTADGAKGIEFPMQGLFGNVGFWLIFWVIPPLLTMRLFAEERSTGTLEMLLTAPVRDGQVVLCKFLACVAFYLAMWLPTLLYLPVLLNIDHQWPGWSLARILFAFGLITMPLGLLVFVFATELWRKCGAVAAGAGLVAIIAGFVMLPGGETMLGPWRPRIDPMPVITAYIGVLSAGVMFLSLGMWISSLVRSQIVAALIALAVNLVFILGGLLILGGYYSTPADAQERNFQIVSFLSVPLHVNQDFARGIIDTRHLVLYGSVTLAMLCLTVQSLERRRWQ